MFIQTYLLTTEFLPTNSMIPVIIDTKNLSRVLELNTKWRVKFNQQGKPESIVSTRNLFGNNHIILSRFILKCVKPNGLYVDHKDRNIFNNTEENLRFVTNTQNQYNRGLMVTNKSGYSGIYRCKLSNKWRVVFRVNGKKTSFGYYLDIEDAITKRKELELEYRGEFAQPI